MTLNVTIKCNGTRRFHVWSQEYNKPNSVYNDRVINVNGSRTIEFKLPVCPKTLFIGCNDIANKMAQDYQLEIEEVPLKTYNIWMDEETMKFLQLSVHFSQVCGFECPPAKGRMFKTKDEFFRIKYVPIIKDYLSGTVLNTPARIGHQSGLIEASYAKMRGYTVPMREAILVHEFGHKYKNPKMGLKISNEFGADKTSLYILLGCGWSKVDIIYVYANVFLKAQTPGNIQRMRQIMQYIDEFESGKIAEVN